MTKIHTELDEGEHGEKIRMGIGNWFYFLYVTRNMKGGSCKVETADILLKYFSIELVEKKKKAR